MRRWRRNPANRAREAARSYDRYVRREARRAFEPPRRDPNRCAWCCFLATTRVERLVIRNGRFEVVTLPYCGTC